MLVIDPVCETPLEEEEAVETVEHSGEVFHFCSRSCLRTFEEDPERFAVEASGDGAELAAS